MKKTLLICLMLKLGMFIAFSQTGISFPGQDSLTIYKGSGQNQILVSGLESLIPENLIITAISNQSQIIEILQVNYLSGQSYAIILLREKGILGIASIDIHLTDGITIIEKSLALHVIEYDNKGMNFEIHDIVFWQEAVPLSSIPVFDTIIDSGQGPYAHLNYSNIPLTVNMDCVTSPPCTGHDFYTAFYKGYIVPPVSGSYTFYMQSSDRFGLWISGNETYSNMKKLVFRGGNNNDAIGESVEGGRVRSTPQELVGGKVYAFYATQWIIHSTGGGILWEGPGINKSYLQKENILFIHDTQKPTAPASLKADWIAGTRVQLSWNPSTDNMKVAGYNLYQDGIKQNDGLIKETKYRLEGLKAKTQYNFVVTAIDQVGNESLISNNLPVTTFPEDLLPPSPPSELELLAATGIALHVKWSGATDSETKVIAYNLYVDGVLYNTDDFIFGDNIVIKNLLPNSPYNLTLEALDASFNVSAPSEEFIVSTIDFDPLDNGLGQKRGRLLVFNKNITWNEGIGLNVPYENGNYPNDAKLREVVEEFGAGAVRWGAITANSRSFAGSTGTSPSHNNTYARVMTHANEIGAFFALTVGVNTDVDYMTTPQTFLRLMEYLNGPSTTVGGARRAAEGYAEPLLPSSPGVILEFGNEVWGSVAHQAPIGANYTTYGNWVRDMTDLIRTSPYYDPEKITFVYSGRYPHPGASYGLNSAVLTGDKGHVESLAVSGYLGGNLNYDPEIPAGDSELDYYKNGIGLSKYSIDGFLLTLKDMVSITGTVKSFYLYEANMTTTSYNGRFGQAIVMTDYFAAGLKYGSILPTVFHLTGGQWKITRPGENYKPLPFYETGKFFNRFCKGHVLSTEFVTNNTITNSSGQIIDWSPVGGYAFNKGVDFSLLLINRDFADSYTVQIELPADLNFSSQARMFTIWNDDFSSFDTNIDSVDVTLSSGMLITVPKHAMVIIAAKADDPEYVQLPHGYFDRVRADSINVYTEGPGDIAVSGGLEYVYGQVFPENAFSRNVGFEILENTANANTRVFTTQSRIRIIGSGVCGNDGHVKVRVYSLENNAIADTLTVLISNQGTNCDVSSDQMDFSNRLFYPNPAENTIHLNGSIDQNSMVEIFDVSGRQLKIFDLKRGYVIPTDDLHSGIYLLRITLPDGKILDGKLKKK
jgi:hypothetical protein